MKRFYQYLSEQWEVAFTVHYADTEHFDEPVVDDAYGTAATADNYLYHVTLRANAERILRTGLLKSGQKKLAGKNLPSNSRNRVFLTDKAGVAFWVNRVYWSAIDTGQYNTRQPEIVVLRVPKSTLRDYVLTPDDVGSREAHAPAWYITGDVDA